MHLLSWNIQWGCGCDGRVSFPRIVDVIRRLGDFDVVCLQEVAVNHPGLAGSTGEDQVAILAAAFPGYSAHYAIASDLAGEHAARRCFGNLLLSRLPVQQIFRHSLPQQAESGRPSMPRVALEAIVATDGGALRVTTTHLEYYSRAQREAQIGQLRTLHEEAFSQAANLVTGYDLDPPFHGPQRPVSSVYCGDFNCESDAEEILRLVQPFLSGAPSLVDAWSVAHPGVANGFTVGLHGCAWPDRAYCCDYFFVSEDLRDRVRSVAVDQETAASDHQPIALKLALEG